MGIEQLDGFCFGRLEGNGDSGTIIINNGLDCWPRMTVSPGISRLCLCTLEGKFREIDCELLGTCILNR